MSRFTKVIAGSGAAVLIMGGSVALATHASAAPAITVVPNENLKGGDKVTVTATGFPPGAPVAIGIVPTGREVKGPGDSGRSKNGYSKLTTTDATGTSTAEITIPEGPLGNVTPPKANCPPCTMGATNIASAAAPGGPQRAVLDLNYASAGTKKTAAADTAADADAPETAAQDTGLAKTGPRETVLLALTGFALLQLGLVLAVRAHRSTHRSARRTLA